MNDKDYKERARERFEEYQNNNYIPNDLYKFYIEESIKLQEEYKDISIKETKRRTEVLRMMNEMLKSIPRNCNTNIGYINWCEARYDKCNDYIKLTYNDTIYTFSITDKIKIDNILQYIKNIIIKNDKHILYVDDTVGMGTLLTDWNINIGINIQYIKKKKIDL